MKKIVTIGSIMMTGILLAGCTLQNNKSLDSKSNNDSGNMMTHDINKMSDMECCSQSGSSMNDGMMMHSIKNEEEFIVNMIPHHQEAVDTAKVILARSTNSELKKLAQNIVEAQTSEISMMQGWLKQRYPNNTVQSNYQNMMPKLESLTGSALDSAFLEGMIMHHMGAIHMAQSVMTVQHRIETMTLANNIIRTQTEEIEMMRGMRQEIK